MAALLLATAFEIFVAALLMLMGIIGILAGTFKKLLANRRSRLDAYTKAERLARLKIISDDYTEVKSFITDNAQYLSEDML